MCWLRGLCETSSWLFSFLGGRGHFPAGMNSVNKIAGSSRNRGREQQSSMSLWLSPGRCSQCVGTGLFWSFHLLQELEWAALCLALQSMQAVKKKIQRPTSLVIKCWGISTWYYFTDFAAGYFNKRDNSWFGLTVLISGSVMDWMTRYNFL